jgi:Protein of unknown function (DUF1549)/Protein of unknown function (DUF1553)/Planctomycete cytochrome C
MRADRQDEPWTKRAPSRRRTGGRADTWVIACAAVFAAGILVLLAAFTDSTGVAARVAPVAARTLHTTTSARIIAISASQPLAADDFVPTQTDRIDFNTQIRPILTKNCLLCHGFDVSTREADLRLDIFEGATAPRGEGEPIPIVPGDANASELIRRVSTTDPDDHMPPGERVPLTADEISLLRHWINEGAAYDQQWSWKPLRNPPTPTIDDPRYAHWTNNPIDGFVFRRLLDAGLTPAPPADRRTLIRRLSFDLIGLPPTPQEVEAFVNDTRDDAYARVVDRLLASPRFGERWARHWLDLSRYAESYGHEFDYNIPDAWRYRDYVIRAFNDDLPYDQFVTEQIAGDLIPNPRLDTEAGTNDSIVGTGFWLLSQGTHAPVDVRHDEAQRVDNQIDVFSKTLMATTIACARCHDHKFDQITTKDYYGLAGYLRSSRRRESMLDVNGQFEQAATAIESVNAQIDQRTRQSTILTAQQTADYLLAVNEALYGTPLEDEPPPQRADLIFDDFEDGDLDGWTIEGTALGPIPQTQATIGPWQGDVGAHGTGFVNSHHVGDGEDSQAADKHTGTMTSGPFVIERPYIRFLIGGGNHPGKTCFELLVDGEVVRSATGHNSNTMHADEFDVRSFVSQSAILRIADRQSGGWGHIGIDHIVFADRSLQSLNFARNISAVAQASGVSEVLLARWVDAVGSIELDPSIPRQSDHPLAPWRSAMDAASVTEALAAFNMPVAAPDDTSHLFEDFATGIAHWFPDGWAMGERESHPGDVWQAGDQTRITTATAAHTGRIATQLLGTLQSPSFTIDSDFIHYRLAGRASRVRLIIDGYFLDEANALLFGGMIIPVDNERFSWHVQDVHRYKGHRAHIEILDEGDGWVAVDEIRFTDTPDAPAPSADPTWLVQFDGADSIAQLAADYGRAIEGALNAWRSGDMTPTQASAVNWLLTNHLLETQSDQITALQEQRAGHLANLPAPARALTLREGTPDDEYVFIRGDHRLKGDTVPRHFPRMLANDQPPITQGSGRLELARLLLDQRDPLPARVMANRVWHHMLGTGIVATPDDFGSLGAQPTHPDLLDALASWYRAEANWSTKSLIRQIALSQTYRMASARTDPLAESADPNNQLLHRANVKRLEGEAIRDAVLAISGELDTTMYGPSVPIHLTTFMTGRGRPAASGPLDGNGRRSVYIEVRRNFLSPFMQAFDMPVPFTTIGKRNLSNVPAQSLILMNDPFIAQQAQHFAGRLLALEGLSARERIDRLHVAAFARHATPDEIEQMITFLQQQSTAPDTWQTDSAAWADLCHVVFNRKEFIFLN